MKAGVYGPTPERLRLAERVRVLRTQGLTHQAVADQLGISRSYASTLADDPDGEKARARKDSYAGTCVDCGAATSGSDGPESTPERCHNCWKASEHARRYWTRDTIVARFQAFHAHTGRVPTATDSHVHHGARLIREHRSATRIAEIDAVPTELRLPHPAVVYRELGSWEKAVRLAGFEPAPTGALGHREKQGRTHMRAYVVFQKNGTGWIPRETVEAISPPDAIQRVADGEGSYVAVPEQHWQERTVAPKTVFAVIEDATAA